LAHRFQRLTRPACRNLKEGEKITEHGITAARTSTGDLRYSINIMVDGQRIHRVVGRESEGVTRERAEHAIEVHRTKAREGRLDLPKGRKHHRSFAEMAKDYLERIEHNPKDGKNLERKRLHFDQRLIPFFKSQRPDKLTDFAIANYSRARLKEGAKPATVNRELATLSHFLNRALEWKWITTRPKIQKGEEVPKQIVILDAAAKRALYDAAVADQDPYLWLFTVIALGTGMRHGEIVRVRWEHIQFDQKRIHLPRAKAGTREQPIPTDLATTLRKEWDQLGQPEGWLFPTSRADAKSDHRQTMAQQFRRAVIRAGLNPAKVTPHVLRHTAITELVKAGVDIPTIQKVSGHKTVEMVLRYTHLSDEHVDQAVAHLDNAFSGTVTPELHEAKKEAG